MSVFFRRIIGALTLSPATFEDVEADRTATAQAMTVVLASAAAAGIGARGYGVTLSVLPGVMLFALLAWAAWAVLTWQIGVRLLPTPGTRSDVGELLRTTGFAAAPGLFRVLGVVPGMSNIVFVVISLWMLFAMIVAIRQALDYTSWLRAVAVCFIGWTLTLLLVFLAGSMLAPVVSAAL